MKNTTLDRAPQKKKKKGTGENIVRHLDLITKEDSNYYKMTRKI